VRLCSDFYRIHGSGSKLWYNILWGDGHVSSH
jgi:prepilin-type processing-associated H-X9-DG protein